MVIAPSGTRACEESIKAHFRLAARVAAALAGSVLVVFLVAVIVLRYGVFPRIDDYRDDIAASVSRAAGMAVSLDDVDAGWQGLRPILTLTGVRVADRQQQTVFAIERAEITLSWWTLLAGDLRFRDVDVYSPQLHLRRGADGLVYLADRPLNAPEPGEVGNLAAWLLDQPGLAVHDASLTWQDDYAGLPALLLRHVEIAVRKSGRRHRAVLTAVPPDALAGKLELRADLQLSRPGSAWQAAGTIYARTDRADLGALRAFLPMPEAFRAGVGSVRLWVDFAPGEFRELTADVDLRDLTAQLDAHARVLDLASLAGRFLYRGQDGGFAASAQNLALRTREGLLQPAADLSWSQSRAAGGAVTGKARARGIDLRTAAALLASLPVPDELRTRAARYAPRGRLLDATLAWTGESLDKASAYRAKARFEDLGIDAVDGTPGASGLNGTLEADERGGTIRLASHGATFAAERVFRAPLTFDTLDLRASWTREAKGLEVKIEAAHLVNADADITVTGIYRSLPGAAQRTPGWVDLAGRVERANARAVANYLPNAIEHTREWLDTAVLAGKASRGRFEIKGDLAHFPFRDANEGRFFVTAAVEEGRLQYHPAWPPVDGVKGEIRFENARLQIEAREASIYASRAKSVRAVIADLSAHTPVLQIEADMDTTGADSARFLRETPLVDGPGAFTRVIAIEGPARLKLALAWPLWGEDPFRLSGQYTFAGATASVGRHLRLEGIRGLLAFTEKSVRAPGLSGSLFGQPATLRLATQPDGSVLTQIDGRLGAPALGAFIPAGFAQRMAGVTDWKARLVTGAAGAELRVESPLKGLAIGLPEPFAKRADEVRALTVTIRQLGTAREEAVASMAGGVHARIGRREIEGRERWHAALRFGSPVATEPVREGLWLYGDLATFDLDAWRAALAAPETVATDPASAALELRGLDLRFATLHYASRDFAGVSARLTRETGEWRGTLAGPTVAGEVTFDSRGKGRIAARLTHFSLGTGSSGAAGPEPQAPTERDDLPALDIVADRFVFHDHWLGRLELVARPEGREWRIDRLDIANAHLQFTSHGVWRRAATGPLTQLDLKLETTNLHALLKQFGYGEFVNRGEARLEGQLVWPGYPYEFTPGALSGRFAVQAEKGQFAKIEPGAGKLLGLISLQSIPRRVSFDFRDIFSEGFAFDRIAGEVKLARGVLLTKDFEVAGPSAVVNMAGEVSLPLETQSLNLKVVPEVGESVAIAATLLGTPVMGLTTLLVQKLLKNPLGKVVSYEYLVTGSWDNPTVTREGALPPPKALAPPATPSRSP